jgi:hypothetical protein
MPGLTLKWRSGVAYVHGTIDGIRIRKSLNTRDPEIAAELARREEAKLKRLPRIQHEFRAVYIISDGRHFKIGIAVDVNKRASGIQTGSSRSVSIVHVEKVRYEDAIRVERCAHKSLQPLRRKGEWFSCTLDQAKEAVTAALSDTIVAHPPKKRGRKLRRKPMGLSLSTDSYMVR